VTPSDTIHTVGPVYSIGLQVYRCDIVYSTLTCSILERSKMFAVPAHRIHCISRQIRNLCGLATDFLIVLCNRSSAGMFHWMSTSLFQFVNQLLRRFKVHKNLTANIIIRICNCYF